MQTPKVVASDFLQRKPKQGWASKAKPIPNPKKRKSEQTPQVVADFLQRNTKQGWASKAKPIPTLKSKEIFNKRATIAKQKPKKRRMSVFLFSSASFLAAVKAKISLVRLGYMVNGIN